MHQLTLREYELAAGVPLSDTQLAALRRLAPSVNVAPAAGGEGCYDLRPGAWVGGLVLPGLAVEIRPKLPIERLLFLVSYTLGRRGWAESPFTVERADTLVEAIVPGFVRLVRDALARGVLQGYRSAEEALPAVRGRVRFDDQLRLRQGRVPPVEVRYDDFTTDIEENRLLKAAVDRLRRLRLRDPATRHALRTFDEALAGVRLTAYDPRRLPEIGWTRLNERYRPAVTLAKLILRSTSFDTRHGELHASAFLVDMTAVFEDFVVLALRDALRLGAHAFPQGAAGRALWLDEGGRIRLRPDVSWWEDGRPVFVGDVKYKRVNAEGVQHPDLYQLLAYTIAADLPGGLLIYAAGEPRAEEAGAHRVVRLGKRLEVVALDLAGPPAGVLAQVAAVAARVRELRAAAARPVVVAGDFRR